MPPDTASSHLVTDVAGTLVVLNVAIVAATLVWVLHTKRETMSAIAWSLLVLLVPFFGAFLFFILGSQSLTRPIARRRRRSSVYKRLSRREGWPAADVPDRWDTLALLGHHGDGFPVTGGNAVALYHVGRTAFDAMLEAIKGARHHVHIQFFIFRRDDLGRKFLDALAECSRRGVKVRFLFDSVGAHNLSSRKLRDLREAGGLVAAFLPMFNPFRRFHVSLRVNLRNHRKLLIVDGRVGFTGGLNVGDEYLGLSPKFGHWRDTHLRVEGPAVDGMQRVFLEDWFFATEEHVDDPACFPRFEQPPGDALVQVVHSGPDMAIKAIRETYFAGILNARKRVWIASPYFVPDAGLRDAMALAARSGVDVRYLGLFRPDKWMPFLAARFYWTEMLDVGVKVYQYAAGMMHSKYVLVDGEWASVGSANFDNRSLLLNFETNCQLFDSRLVAELEGEFLNDLEKSVRLDPAVFAGRPFFGRLAENAARLFSPIL
jgi:cardiolipin synthase